MELPPSRTAVTLKASPLTNTLCYAIPTTSTSLAPLHYFAQALPRILRFQRRRFSGSPSAATADGISTKGHFNESEFNPNDPRFRVGSC
jgi:hypothetical protein